MLAFITGSRAYGTVKPSSDVDLVIRCTLEMKQLLQKLSDKIVGLAGEQLTIRFGKCNIIACTTDEEFAVWRIGTTQMKNSVARPYDKIAAKQVLDTLREMVGLTDIRTDSGGYTPAKSKLTTVEDLF